ncbi:MAG TPA: TIM-barrel domain-containing protein [Gemmatimonadales bacterium]|nr:TIM-barrel domain-containing protein [Gemmatimonadales bacterium]
MRLVLPLMLGIAPGLVAQAPGGAVRLPFTNLSGRPDRLVVDQIRRDGRALADSGVHVRRLSDGVTEITAQAAGPVMWELEIREQEPVFGFGERFDALDQSGKILVNASSDTPGPKGTGTYVPMPFFLDLRGYGVWLDTYAEAVFDLGATHGGEFTVRFRDTRLRLVVIEGPGFPRILERFTGLVGRAKVPPYWAFAPWKSRNWHPDMAAVYEDVDRYRALGLPASVLVLDSPWATNYNTFLINRLQFTDPGAMVRHIHEQGFKLCLWLTAFIDSETFTPSEPELVGKIPLTEASNYEDARRRGYFLKAPSGDPYVIRWWKGRGGLIDFTKPAAVTWWQDQVRQAIRAGADAFKADGGEGSFVPIPDLRTRYSVLYNRALEQLIDGDLKGDGVLFSRSGSVGSHDLPFIWAGDNQADFGDNGLPSVVRAGLNAGLSGISLWTSDLGGYEKDRRTPGDDTVFVRWTEFSAFSPVMEVHSAINLGPWDYGDQALDIFRRFSRLHMSLFPYRYAAAQESHRTGMPMMRALVLLHPLDSAARAATDEYEFGPDLLVAPVVTPGTRRDVYLPAGDWIDYWSGKAFQGPVDLAVDVPLDRVPLYVKAGAILPEIPEDVMTLVPGAVNGLDERRIYEVYPGPARSLEDFEGRRLETSDSGGRRVLRLTGKAAKVTVVWRFQHPVGVALNGRPVATSDAAAVSFDHSGESVITWRDQ